MFNGPAQTTKGGGAVDPMMGLLAAMALVAPAARRLARRRLGGDR